MRPEAIGLEREVRHALLGIRVAMRVTSTSRQPPRTQWPPRLRRAVVEGGAPASPFTSTAFIAPSTWRSGAAPERASGDAQLDPLGMRRVMPRSLMR